MPHAPVRTLSFTALAVAVLAFTACDRDTPTGVDATPAAVPSSALAAAATTGPVTQISAGGSPCALRSNGTVVCWGNDFHQQASPPFSSFDFTHVEAGAEHACAVTVMEGVVCWGDASHGATMPPPLSYSRTSGGRYHSCGITAGPFFPSRIVCWGDDSQGQLTGIPSGVFTEVSAGAFHTCAIRSDGTLACWGLDLDGQATPPTGTFISVGAGNYHSCGVRSDGTLACWGRDTFGQATPPAGTFTQVSAGGAPPLGGHSCAIRSSGTLACWGSSLGGSHADMPGDVMQQVSAGGLHTCALRANGTVACWGDNSLTGETDVPPELAGVGTTTALVATPTTSTYGQSVTFTATVTHTVGGTAVTGGTVTFIQGGACPQPATVHAAQVPLSGSGQASFTTAALPVGLQFLAACFNGSETVNASSGLLTHRVDPAATVTTVTVVPALQQYSDRTTLTATVSPAVVNGSVAAGRVQFRIDGSDVGAPVALGAGGTASLANVPLMRAAGGYPVTAVFTSSSAQFAGSTGSASVTVTREHAMVVYGDANPAALQVGTPGGALSAGALTLAIGVQERSPDAAVAPGTSGPGDIANAGLAVTLAPVGPGSGYTLQCQAAGVSGSGYAAARTFTCTNTSPIAVNAYEVRVAVTGAHYIGTHADVVTVFDPSLGFASGGGSFLLDGDRVRFGFNLKYKKNGAGAKGSVIVVRQHADGTSSRIASNALGDLALGEDPAVPMGWAALTGKATYTTRTASAQDDVTTGGQSFTVYVEDRDKAGGGADRIWVGGPPALALPGSPGTARSNAAEITGGNVVVPHRGGGSL